MNTDENVELAIQLSEQLLDVDRNEWKKWIEYLKRHGNLDNALFLSQQLSQSPMLRAMPQHAYIKINQVIKKHRSTLIKLSPEDMHQLFGFVSWSLFGRLSTPLEGRLKQKNNRRR
jgi:hypothetical protein